MFSYVVDANWIQPEFGSIHEIYFQTAQAGTQV